MLRRMNVKARRSNAKLPRRLAIMPEDWNRLHARMPKRPSSKHGDRNTMILSLDRRLVVLQSRERVPERVISHVGELRRVILWTAGLPESIDSRMNQMLFRIAR